MFQPADARALQTFVARLDPPEVADEHMHEVLEGIARGAAAFGGKRLFDGDRRMAVVLSEVDDAVYFLHTVAASKTLVTIRRPWPRRSAPLQCSAQRRRFVGSAR